MSYKIIKHNKDSYQILHPDGTKFTVPKKGLSSELAAKIDGLPKFYEGGNALIGGSDNPNEEMIVKEPSQPIDLWGPVAMNNGPAAQMPAAVPVSMPAQDAEQPQAIMEPQVQRTSAGLPSEPAEEPQQQMQQSNPDLGRIMPEEQPALKAIDASIREAKNAGYAQNKFANDLEANLNKLAADREAMAKEHMEKLAAIDAEGQKIAAQKEDPERYWKSHNKIMAAVAIGLGASGGGENPALKIIDSAIKNDIEAQRNDKNSLYNANLAKFKNAELAYNLTAQNALKRAEDQIKIYSAKSSSAESQMKAANMIASLQMQRESLKQNLSAQVQSDVLTRKAISGDLPNEYTNYLSKDVRERYVPGQGVATSAEGAKKVREVVANRNDIHETLNKIQALKNKYGTEIWSSPAATEAKALGQFLVGKLREPILGPGTMQQQEYDRLQAVIPNDVTAIFSLDKNNQAKIDTLRASIDNNLSNKLSAEGITPKLGTFNRAGENKLPMGTSGVKLPLNGRSL